jgi:hypothetical protein
MTDLELRSEVGRGFFCAKIWSETIFAINFVAT